ncbi:uncharacterized protein LOC135212910 [Macrobrachium nipponense]|uniref:uncharacterized protein LOC135212910 n=1 Tax=Macrobrachium nipponense TaxID=159736 RepID=UPI0030C7C5A0
MLRTAGDIIILSGAADSYSPGAMDRLVHCLVQFVVFGLVIASGSEQDCPVEHICNDFGLELLSSNTGEAAFCSRAGAKPRCPGIDINGDQFIRQTSSSSEPAAPTASTSLTQESTHTSPETHPETTRSSEPETSKGTTVISTGTTAALKVTTHDMTTISPASVATSTPRACEELSCTGRTEGKIYAYPECNCKKYFVCVDTGTERGLVYHTYRCLGSAVFDKNSNKCTTNQTVCPF